jgi:hypothetical protein
MEVWDIEANCRVATLGGHATTVTAVDFSADEATLSSGSRDSTALVWERTCDRCIRTCEGERRLRPTSREPAVSAPGKRDARHRLAGCEDGIAPEPGRAGRAGGIFGVSPNLLRKNELTPAHRTKATCS